MDREILPVDPIEVLRRLGGLGRLGEPASREKRMVSPALDPIDVSLQIIRTRICFNEIHRFLAPSQN